jgi:hypothetical protein
MTHFLKEGLAYLFVASVSALKSPHPPEIDELSLERVRLSYLIKFGL